MTGATLVVREPQMAALVEMARSPVECAAVLLVGIAATSPPRVIVRDVASVPTEAIERQSSDELVIRSEGYMPALARAERLRASAVFVHTHPGSTTEGSDRDKRVDELLAPMFVSRTGSAWYGSVRLSLDSEGVLTFAGEMSAEGRFTPFTRALVVGDRLRLFGAADAPPGVPVAAIFDRHVRAFGPDFQHLLGQLTIGVVGCGGTGSATAEELTRLGVGTLLLFDDQRVTDTNLTRIHETVRSDIGRRKVDVLAERLEAAGTGTRAVAVPERITDRLTAERLRECDVVFGCTDDDTGRAVLNRLAIWYVVPVFDMAFVIDSEAGELRGLVGRVTTLLPGNACLLCRERLDPGRLYDAALPFAERDRLVGEGYARELPDVDPAVVPFATSVASLAVGELVERIVGYDQPPPSEVLFLPAERRISRSRVLGEERHWCGHQDRWGLGDVEPFLDRVWTQ